MVDLYQAQAHTKMQQRQQLRVGHEVGHVVSMVHMLFATDWSRLHGWACCWQIIHTWQAFAIWWRIVHVTCLQLNQLRTDACSVLCEGASNAGDGG